MFFLSALLFVFVCMSMNVSLCQSLHISCWIITVHVYFFHHLLLTPFPHHITSIFLLHIPPVSFFLFFLFVWILGLFLSHSLPPSKLIILDSVMSELCIFYITSASSSINAKWYCCCHQVKQKSEVNYFLHVYSHTRELKYFLCCYWQN